MSERVQDDPHEEGEPLPLDDERESPAFATVRVVDVTRGEGWAQDVRWHNEMREGQACPQCYIASSAGDKGRKHGLKRWKNSVYCGFCRVRWWSKRTV